MSRSNLRKVNLFLAMKLPSAFISGIRVKELGSSSARATVRHRWINQNPFKSLYWATQGMAAELVTGLLVMKKIADSNRPISMLVVDQHGSFHKKATGLISFSCDEGQRIDDAIRETLESGEGHTFTLAAKGINEEGTVVSEFEFTWSIKVKS